MSINSLNTFLNVKDSHLRVVSGNVYATAMNIGGINVDVAHGLQSVTNQGNVTSNTLQFSNATTAFTTTANATVGRDLTVTGNATVSSNLTVTGNAVISDDLTVTENLLVSNNLTVTGNTFYTNPAAVLVDSNVVTEYTGPHDRPLRKYPEVAMTADVVANDSANTYTQAGYTVTASSQYIGNGTIYRVWKIFDEKLGGSPAGETWIQGDLSAYDINGDYVLSPANNLGTGADDGEWVKLELPNKITLERIHITPRDSNREPEDFKIYGSIDNVNWVEILSETGASPAITTGTSYMVDVRTTSYKYLGMVIKKIVGSGYFAIDNLELYGYEEGSGSLDTTLKSVYNVPATTGTQLEVYYDGRDYTQTSDFTGTGGVVDKAGGDQDGTAGTGVTFDTTYKAFVFDASGSGTVTTSKITSSTLPSTFVDNAHHSVAMWFKLDTITGEHTLFTIKDNTNGFSYQTPHVVIDEGILRYDFWSNNIQLLDQIVANEWYHLVITFSGGNHQSGTKFYINGVHNTNVSTPSGTDNLDIQVNSVVYLGGSISSYERGIDGSVANFRLYSKALNAGQVQELYDYQKDYFLGSKSQVTLYKGHLGVGVTEPSGQLELAGDERIQQYPPGPMSANESVIAGHGIFKARSSPSSTNLVRQPCNAFDHDLNSGWDSSKATDDYSASDGSYTAADGGSVTLLSGGGTYSGEFLEIELPYPIKLRTNQFYPLQSVGTTYLSDYGIPRFFREALILGSNDGHTWDTLQSISETSYSFASEFNEYITVDTNSETYYKYFRVAANKVIGGTYGTRFNINEWKLFGTPGPTTLDKGSLSLGRSLDVPRVSRYDVDTETPRPEKLVVDFDTTVNSSPTDISGKGNHGAFYNGAYYSAADKAFFLDGTDDYIGAESISFVGGFNPFTISLWVNVNVNTGHIGLTQYGVNASNDSIGLKLVNGQDEIEFFFYSNDVRFTWTPVVNQWYHLVANYDGGTDSGVTGGQVGVSRKIWVDGVELLVAPGTRATAGTITQPSLPANSALNIGARIGGTESVNGKISNFKFYNVALEASEVRKLYKLGRTGRSMVISDTAVGIGKVPEAQLDVRGVARLERLLINGTLGHILLEEAEIYYDPSRADCQDRSEFMNNTVRDIKGNYNGTKTGISEYNQFWDQDVENSGIATNNNVDLRRDWTAMVWLKPNTNDNLSGWRILGHGTTTTNGGLHFQGADTTKIRAGMYGNDIDVGTVTGMSRRREWNCMTFAYYHNNGVAGGCDKMIYQNERLVGHQQGGVGDGTHFSNNVGGSAAQNGHQPYSASPNKLRFGAGFSSGSSGKQYQHIGPCIFIPRFLSIQEVRSLYRFFEMRYSLAGSSSG